MFAQNFYYEYTLEPPCGGGSNEYPQSCVLDQNKNKRTIGPVPHLRDYHIVS